MKVDHGPRSSLVENHTVHSCTILYVHVESELKSLRTQMKSFAALDPPNPAGLCWSLRRV